MIVASTKVLVTDSRCCNLVPIYSSIYMSQSGPNLVNLPVQLFWEYSTTILASTVTAILCGLHLLDIIKEYMRDDYFCKL